MKLDVVDSVFSHNWISMFAIESSEVFIGLIILAIELLILYVFIGPLTQRVTKRNETKRWAETRKRFGAHLFAAIDDAVANIIYSVMPYKHGIAISRRAVETDFDVKGKVDEVRQVIDLYASALDPKWVNHVASMSSLLWQMGRLGSSLRSSFISAEALDETDASVNDKWKDNALELEHFEIDQGRLGSYHLTSDRKTDSRLSFAAHISYILNDALVLMRRHNEFMLSSYSLNETLQNPYQSEGNEIAVSKFIDIQKQRISTIEKIQTSLVEGRFYFVIVTYPSSDDEEFAQNWSGSVLRK